MTRPPHVIGSWRRPTSALAALALALTIAPRLARADDPEPLEPIPQVAEGPYAQGKVRVGVGGGLLSRGSEWNFGLSLSFGYFVVDNVELGADSAIQFGDDPFAAMLGPTARVLFPINEAVHPYLGAFYRHWFLTGGLDDFDTVGARAGIVVRTGVTYFGIGLVYEAIVSECEGDCAELYPELGVSVVF